MTLMNPTYHFRLKLLRWYKSHKVTIITNDLQNLTTMKKF